MTLLGKLVRRSKSRDSLGHRRSASGASASSAATTHHDKALPPTPTTRAGTHTADGLPVATAAGQDGTREASKPAVNLRSSAHAEAASQADDPHSSSSAAAATSNPPVIPDLIALLHGRNTSTDLPGIYSSTGIPASSSHTHVSGDARLAASGTSRSRTSAAGAGPTTTGIPPSISLPHFDEFAVPLSSTTVPAATDSVEGTIAGTTKPSGDDHIHALSLQLESTALSSSSPSPAAAATNTRTTTTALPKSSATAHALVGSPLDFPDLHPARTHGLTERSLARPDLPIAPHATQNAALLARIRADHQPAHVPLSEAGKALFARAGLEVHDPEGRGTVDWLRTVEEPVVRETVVHHVEQVYEPVVVARSTHATHIHPKIQPVIPDRPTSPSAELHYFPTGAPGQFYEVRGRAAALDVLRSARAEQSDKVVADYWCDREVRRELAELEALVRGDRSAEEGRKVLDVKRWNEVPLLPASSPSVVRGEKSQDAKVPASGEHQRPSQAVIGQAL